MAKGDLKNLKKRYLIWLYKTAKEELDRIERKFTQLEIDRFILKELKRLDGTQKAKKFIEEFNAYIDKKEKDGLNLKYEGSDLKAGYYFITIKLQAIEKAIENELGKRSLKNIKILYEQKQIERILESTEH